MSFWVGPPPYTLLLILIKQMHRKSVKFAIVGTLKILALNINHMFAMVVMVKCKKLLVLTILLLFMLKDLLTEFTFGIWTKNYAIRIMNNSNLNDKMGVLYYFY